MALGQRPKEFASANLSHHLREIALVGNDKVRTFQFIKEIASGGFGSVYLTKITHPDGFSRLTAVKLMHRRWSDNEEISRRMRDEARLLGWLRHRNIVDVVDLTSLDGRTAIIMEYLEAVDLKQIIRASSQDGEPFPVKAVFEIMQAAASALDAAYNRPPYAGEKPLCVIHRDIKPSNIMVDDSGHVKVLDFGVARADFAERESQTRELQFGSVDYMPPERLLFEPESPGSDIYSLASTAFEMMCLEKLGKAKGSPLKHAAFVAERIESLRNHLNLSSELGDTIAQLLSECLSYESSDRPDAVQVFSQCRLLSRQVGGLGLGEWSEGHVPGMLNEASLEEPTSMNPLTGRTYQEDSVSYLGPPTKTSDETLQPPNDTVSDFDPRWEMLRNAAAAELAPNKEEPFVEGEDPTTADEGLGPSLNASLTLGGGQAADDLDDMDEVATTMISRESIEDDDDDDDDATCMMPRVANDDTVLSLDTDDDDDDDDDDEGATRILTHKEIDAVSSASEEIRSSSKKTSEPESEEIELEPVDDEDGSTMMLSEETKNLLGGAALLGDRKPQPAETPPVFDNNPAVSNASIGSETILVNNGPDNNRAGASASVPVSSTKRFFISAMIFATALGAGLGLGSLMFYDELYGEKGAISSLFSSKDGSAAQEMTLPGPIGEPVEATVQDANSTENEAIPSGSEILVRSLAEGTRKLVVRCGGEQFTGVAEVRFGVPKASSCSVKAMMAGSGRLSAKLTKLEPGEINCFAGGEKRCE